MMDTNHRRQHFWNNFTVANWVQIILILFAIMGQMVRDMYRYDARIIATEFRISATENTLAEMKSIVQRADVLVPQLQEINRRLGRLEQAAGLRPLQ